MPSQATYTIVCLWEHEIRAAAHALERFREAYDNEASSDEARAAALEAVIARCGAALAGAEQDDAALVLSRVPNKVA